MPRMRLVRLVRIHRATRLAMPEAVELFRYLLDKDVNRHMPLTGNSRRRGHAAYSSAARLKSTATP